MESKYGCPDDGKITWSKGMRHQDTEDVRSDNSYTAGIQNYMKGAYKIRMTNVLVEFYDNMYNFNLFSDFPVKN